MNISYIKHSGVLVETKNSHFLFDYIGGALPLLKQNTNIFVSHAHEDHFSSKIFSLPRGKFNSIEKGNLYLRCLKRL